MTLAIHSPRSRGTTLIADIAYEPWGTLALSGHTVTHPIIPTSGALTATSGTVCSFGTTFLAQVAAPARRTLALPAHLITHTSVLTAANLGALETKVGFSAFLFAVVPYFPWGTHTDPCDRITGRSPTVTNTATLTSPVPLSTHLITVGSIVPRVTYTDPSLSVTISIGTTQTCLRARNSPCTTGAILITSWSGVPGSALAAAVDRVTVQHPAYVADVPTRPLTVRPIGQAGTGLLTLVTSISRKTDAFSGKGVASFGKSSTRAIEGAG